MATTKPVRHRALRDANGAHIGYVDYAGRVFTVKGNQSFARKPNGRLNKAHYNRIVAAEQQYGIERENDDQS